MSGSKEAKIVKGRDGKLNLENFYTPLSEARKEIWRRWNDDKLRKKVEDFLEGYVPNVFSEEPKAILFRYIATPDFEYSRARDLSDEIGLKLLYLEYLGDKFCTINPDKRTLGRMIFFHAKNINGDNIISKKNIFDLAQNDGKPFEEIITFSGINLVDFHHQLFKSYFWNSDFWDITNFAKQRGKNASETYPFFLSLFACFGVLFEAYDINHSKEEYRFVDKVVCPAFNRISKTLGVNPIIVRLYTNGDEGNGFWSYYPEFLKNSI
jgi:hypothetical protein